MWLSLLLLINSVLVLANGVNALRYRRIARAFGSDNEVLRSELLEAEHRTWTVCLDCERRIRSGEAPCYE